MMFWVCATSQRNRKLLAAMAIDHLGVMASRVFIFDHNRFSVLPQALKNGKKTMNSTTTIKNGSTTTIRIKMAALQQLQSNMAGLQQQQSNMAAQDSMRAN